MGRDHPYTAKYRCLSLWPPAGDNQIRDTHESHALLTDLRCCSDATKKLRFSKRCCIVSAENHTKTGNVKKVLNLQREVFIWVVWCYFKINKCGISDGVFLPSNYIIA